MDGLSLSSIQIICYCNDTKLSTATGFIIKKKDQLYLVTNWHIVSGRDHNTYKELHKELAIPNKIRIKYNNYGQDYLDTS